MSSDEEFLVELLGALEGARLEAIVVGATAAVLQGAPVMTQDIDLLVRDTPRNRQKIVKVAATLGAGAPMALSPLSSVLRLVGARAPVDFMFDQMGGGLSFASVRSRSVSLPFGRYTAIVASLEDVIRSKEAANRPKDLAALPILRDTLRVKNALAETE